MSNAQRSHYRER